MKKDIFPIVIENEADYILFKLYERDMSDLRDRGACLSCNVSLEDRMEREDYKTNFKRMFSFALWSKGRKEKVSKGVVVELIEDGFLYNGGGGTDFKIYDLSWCLTPKGRRYCRGQHFNKLVGKIKRRKNTKEVEK